MHIRLPFWSAAASCTFLAASPAVAHPPANEVDETVQNSGADFTLEWTDDTKGEHESHIRQEAPERAPHPEMHGHHHPAPHMDRPAFDQSAWAEQCRAHHSAQSAICDARLISVEEIHANYPQGYGPAMLVPVMVAIPQRAIIHEYVTEEWVED